MTGPSRIDWYNENEGRGYPMAEAATRVDDDGNRVADDIIADLGLTLPGTYADARIASIYVSAQIISVVISTAAGGLLTGAYARASISPYKAYALTPVTDDASGWIVFGNHIVTATERHILSTAAQGAIERRCIRVIPPPGVKSFRRLGNAEAIDGIVRLTAASEFEILLDPDNASNIIVRLQGDSRYAFSEACQRQASASDCGVPIIRRINNVPADSNGKITLRFQ